MSVAEIWNIAAWALSAQGDYPCYNEIAVSLTNAMKRSKPSAVHNL